MVAGLWHTVEPNHEGALKRLSLMERGSHSSDYEMARYEQFVLDAEITATSYILRRVPDNVKEKFNGMESPAQIWNRLRPMSTEVELDAITEDIETLLSSDCKDMRTYIDRNVYLRNILHATEEGKELKGDGAIIRCMVNGIKDPDYIKWKEELQRQKLHHGKSFDDFVRMFEEQVAIIERLKEQHTGNRGQVSFFGGEPEPARQEERECHRCGKKGHIAADCWAKVPKNKLGQRYKGNKKEGGNKGGKNERKTRTHKWTGKNHTANLAHLTYLATESMSDENDDATTMVDNSSFMMTMVFSHDNLPIDQSESIITTRSPSDNEHTKESPQDSHKYTETHTGDRRGTIEASEATHGYEDSEGLPEIEYFNWSKGTDTNEKNNERDIDLEGNLNINESNDCTHNDTVHKSLMAGNQYMADDSHIHDSSAVLDSGCTEHMFGCQQEQFKHYKRTNININSAKNGVTLKCVATGTLPIQKVIDESTENIDIDRVMHTPNISANLLSVSRLVDDDLTVTFNKQEAVIYDDQDSVRFVCPRKGNLFLFTFDYVNKCDPVYSMHSTTDHDIMALHFKHNHASLKKLRELSISGDLDDVDKSIRRKLITVQELVCDACARNKQRKRTLPKHSTTVITETLEVVSADHCGPFPRMHGGYTHFTVFTDHFTNMTFLFLTSSLTANTLIDHMKQLLALTDTQINKKIFKHLRSDKGSDFHSKVVREFVSSKGAFQQVAAPGHHGQNGKVERRHRTLNEEARCLLDTAGVPYKYYFYAVACANEVSNRSSNNGNAPPIQQFFKKKFPPIPDIVFGSHIIAVRPSQWRKSDPSKSDDGIYLGPDTATKDAILMLNLATKEVVTRRDYKFRSGKFPFQIGIPSKPSTTYDLDIDQPSARSRLYNVIHKYTDDDVDGCDDEMDGYSDCYIETSDDDDDGNSVDMDGCDGNDDDMNGFGDCYEDVNEHMAGITFVAREEGMDELAVFHALNAMHEESYDLPNTLYESQQTEHRDGWKKGIIKEMKAHEKQRTFSIVQRPKGAKVVGSRFVFAFKYDDNECITDNKVRLVAKGFSQKYGEHFTETFAPTLSPTTFRVAISICAQRGYDMRQMDVSTAFLIPPLPENELVYMQPPPGFEVVCKWMGWKYQKGMVLKLHKCIYGLKQSGRYWNQKLVKVMKQVGFKSTNEDPCLFIRYDVNDGVNGLIVCHVDDLIVMANDDKETQQVSTKLSKHLPMKDLGKPKKFLGLKIERPTKHHITIHQQHYITKVLEDFRMLDCKPNKTPTSTHKLIQEGKPAPIGTPYRKAVGCLLWLAINTRPDIAYAVGQVAKFCERPTVDHWTAVKHIFRYLKGTQSYGIHLSRNVDCLDKEVKLTVYSDADWAGEETRRSTGGYLVFAQGLISWKCAILRIICLSSMESEIVFYSRSCREIAWLLKLYTTLGIKVDLPVPVKGDNQAAIKASENERVSDKTKHIAIANMYVRQAVKEGTVKVTYVPSEENLADILTKPLGAQKFVPLVKGLNLA